MTTVHLLHAGYAGDRVGSSIVLVRDADALIVVDPGMVARRSLILDPLRELGVAPEAVTHVFLSHHHPDHTVNIALFPRARVHDHWAVYDGDLWTSRDADGVQLSPSVRLLRTPGHTPEDISTLVGTADGVLAFTHAWWQPDGPVDDPYAPDAAVLLRSRQLLLAAADTIVPGHGAPFPAADAPL
jgi:glyoxylase-like metal-dependent hydrolase (beta-lactamase superfamily II)